MQTSPGIFSTRTSWFLIGILVGVVAGSVIGFSLGFGELYRSIKLQRVEENFAKVKPGMSSGEALKAIFENVLIFPEQDPKSATEAWPIWGYDSAMMIDARKSGSRPFTLVIDKQTGKVVSAGRVYNTRFD